MSRVVGVGWFKKKSVCDYCGSTYRGDGISVPRFDKSVRKVCGWECRDALVQESAREWQAHLDEAAKVAAGQAERVAEHLASGRVHTLRASFEGGVASHVVSRVGGRAIGCPDERWPMWEGDPMVHLLTLDVRGLELPLPAEVAAVSVFIARVFENEAFDRSVGETAVRLLTEEDLALGEAAPRSHPPEDVLEPGTLHAAPAESSDRTPAGVADLYRTCYVGGEPLWAQGPETDVGRFVMQFDASLLRGSEADFIFGDAGVMYVFDDTAFWQPA